MKRKICGGIGMAPTVCVMSSGIDGAPQLFFVLLAVCLLSGCGIRSGMANRVLGQPDFVHGDPNQGLLLPTDATMNLPAGIASSNWLFVADSGNNRVMGWMSPESFTNGQAADVIIGQPPNNDTGQPNWEGGVSAKGLNHPTSVAYAGDLAVADTGNHRVLLYESPFQSGMAASRVYGQDLFSTNDPNHHNLETGLNGPAGVAFDDNGGLKLYISDTGNHRVVRYDLTRDYTARDLEIGQADIKNGNQPNEGFQQASATSLAEPRGLAVSWSGDLYVADTGNNRVLGYTSSTEYTTPLQSHAAATLVIGQPDFTSTQGNRGLPSPRADTLYRPSNISLDAGGNLYVADGSHRVLRYTAPIQTGAAAKLVIGQPDFTQRKPNNGGLDERALNSPNGVSIDSNQDLIVADTLNHRVLKYFYFQVPFDNLPDVMVDAKAIPYGLAIDLNSGRLFAATDDRVLSWASVANLLDTDAPDLIIGQKNLKTARSLAVDSAGNLWVADPDNNRVVRFSKANQWVVDRVLGQPDLMHNAPGTSRQNLDHPFGVAVILGIENMIEDYVYVADTGNNRVLFYGAPYDNLASGIVGQNGYDVNLPNRGSNTASEKGFDQPRGVALDSQGALYVADYGNSRVVRYPSPFALDSPPDRVFGQKDFFSRKVNQGQPFPNAIGLNGASALAVDGNGHLYVADWLNSRVLEYSVNGLLSGQPAERAFGQQVFVRGGQLSGRFGFAYTAGVALDGAGDLVISDLFGARILKYITPIQP